MPDRPTLADIPEVHDRDALEEDLIMLVRRAAHALRPDTAFADAGDAARSSSAAESRADRLALLTATEALRAALDEQASIWVNSLGQSPHPPTYADLGDAVGITRQSARTRWPHALPDARPGRPKRP